MKIIVCIKQVPVRDSQLAIEGNWVRTSDLTFEINEPDSYALEAALQLKEQFKDEPGSEVVALCAGPASASQIIREALAKGADRALHIEQEGLEHLDTLATGRLLAAAIKRESPNLILTGLQSDDQGYGQTGVVVAELLGVPHATLVMEVERRGESVRVKRELEDGWFQHVEIPLPAVLTVQSGISKLRYATLMGIKKARTKEVKHVTPAELAVDLKSTAAVARVYAPPEGKQTQFLTGSPKEVAAKLIEKLRFEARVL